MNDTPKTLLVIDLVNNIKLEIQNTIEQLKLAVVNSSSAGVNQVSVLATKMNTLSVGLHLVRDIALFEEFHSSLINMKRSGDDLRNAFIELTDKKDPKAAEYIQSLVNAWDAASLGASLSNSSS